MVSKSEIVLILIISIGLICTLLLFADEGKSTGVRQKLKNEHSKSEQLNPGRKKRVGFFFLKKKRCIPLYTILYFFQFILFSFYCFSLTIENDLKAQIDRLAEALKQEQVEQEIDQQYFEEELEHEVQEHRNQATDMAKPNNFEKQPNPTTIINKIDSLELNLKKVR